jgi:hypothetical protein
MTMAKALRSQPYRGARDLGKVQAARRGPGSYGNRLGPAIGLSVDEPGHRGVPAEPGF